MGLWLLFYYYLDLCSSLSTCIVPCVWDFAFPGWQYWTALKELSSLEILVQWNASVSGHVWTPLQFTWHHCTFHVWNSLHVPDHVPCTCIQLHVCGALPVASCIHCWSISTILHCSEQFLWCQLIGPLYNRSAWVYRHSVEIDQLLACPCLWMCLYYNTKRDASWFVGVDEDPSHPHWHSYAKLNTHTQCWSMKLYCIPNGRCLYKGISD